MKTIVEKKRNQKKKDMEYVEGKIRKETKQKEKEIKRKKRGKQKKKLR